uniref:Fibronectin type-III domain-containing protein n=1 Tax=Fundulus heteroclitus TaxID=8078 RepID=A0A3Q2R277_FUNHE
MAEEEAFDTLVLMLSQAKDPGQPRELVLSGEERNVTMSDLTEDTEYDVEIFGLMLGKRSKPALTGNLTSSQLVIFGCSSFYVLCPSLPKCCLYLPAAPPPPSTFRLVF